MSEELDSKTPPTDPTQDGAADQNDPDSEVTPFVITLPDDPASNKDWYLWAGVLAILALVSFWPAIQGSFIWDDDHYITQNIAMRTLSGLVHCWIPPIQTIQYYPLTYSMFWIEWHLWKNFPLGYHVVNLLLHAGSAILIWRLLRRLAIPGAWVAAAIWAVHPLQAESVCWITERKNILSGLLFFASAWFYLEFAGVTETEENRTTLKLGNIWKAFGLSLLLFTAALCAKTVACSLPAVLLVVLWWKDKLNRRNVLGTIPFFVIGLALALITTHFETDPNGYVGATGADWALSFPQRLLIAGRGIWFYVGKLILPLHLSFNYPRILPNPSDPMAWLYVVATVAVLAILFALRKRIGRGPLAAVLFYILTLFPSLGFVNVFPFRYSFVADHFQYVSCLGLIVLVVAAIARLVPAKERSTEVPAEGDLPSGPSAPQSVAAVLAGAVAITLAAVSWGRSNVFTDNASLWINTYKENPSSWLAAYNLGIQRDRQIDIDLGDAATARQENDNDSAATLLTDAAGQADEATSLFKHVLDNPNTPAPTRYLTYNGLGGVENRRGHFPKANVLEALDKAAADFALAIDGEKQLREEDAKIGHTRLTDPTPYLNMGIVKLEYAQALEEQLPRIRPTTEPSSATQPVATQAEPMKGAATMASSMALSTQPSLPATRPATPDEQAVVDKALEAEDYLNQAILAANEQMKNAKDPLAERVPSGSFALATFNRGQTEYLLSNMASRCNDQNEYIRRTKIAAHDYSESLKANPDNPETAYQLARCLDRFERYEQAYDLLMRAIQLSPGSKYAQAYNESGWIRLRNAHTMDDLDVAIQAFQAALDQQPDYPEAKANLDAANDLKQKALAAAATRASTMPTTAPATAP